MCDSTSRSDGLCDGLCDRCSRFLHFRGGEHGFYAEITDKNGTVHIDFEHTRDGKKRWRVESQFQLEDDYPAMTELNRSASRGCGFCNLLLDAIHKDAPEVDKNMVLLINEGYIQEGSGHYGYGYNVDVVVRWEVTDSKTKDDLSLWFLPDKESFFRLLANQDTLAAKYLKLWYAPVHPSLLCSENVARIQKNLSHCLENHKQCAEIRPTGHWKHQALPSRLVEIKKDQEGYRIRLVQMQLRTSPEPGILHPKYAALSYCWGDQDFIKSTTENIMDHYSTIAFSKLPPGFQDTIELCWGIGIFYLWIDSLCIIQGDQSDWDRESARMKDVYANASITIILASTSSPLEGLSNVSTKCCSDLRVSYRLDDDNGPEITYFIQSPSSTRPNLVSSELELDYEQSIRASEWIKRGWTFQESFLSTRKLFICADHTDFSCRTSSCLEGILRICQPLQDLGLSAWTWNREPGDWYDLVGFYSGRKLSRSEDKLPAISAVASLMEEGYGDYVAGLWTNNLERGLLWAPDQDAYKLFPLKRQTTYRGPTWSWCAYDGSISYGMVLLWKHLTRAFDILEIRWTLAEPSAIYGRLSTADGDRAYLRIRAKVAWVIIQYLNDVTDHVVSAVMEPGRIERMDQIFMDCGATEGFESPQRVAALLVATVPLKPHAIYYGYGLFLRPIPSLGPVITYERVGCFRGRRNQLDVFTQSTEVQELCLV